MDGNERENLVTVPPEAGAGPGKTTHQTSEDSGGVEGLPEAAREVGKDELQGHNHHRYNSNYLMVITTTLLSEDHKAAKCQVNAVQAPLEMRVASRLSYEKYTFLTEGGGVYYHILATSTKHNLVYKTGRTIRPQGCYEALDHGKKFVECVVNNVDESNKIAGQTIYR